jgi:hypothetical protein
MGHTATASSEPGFGTQDLLAADNAAKLNIRRAYYDHLMLDVVQRQSELDDRDRRRRRLSVLISTILASTAGLTGYILFG